MLKNYITTAVRNLVKNKFFTFVNMLGLTAGITCCILISVYVKHELAYDGFQEKGSRLARVIMEYNMGGTKNGGNYTSTYVGPSFKSNFPEVEDFVRMYSTNRIVKYNDKVFAEDRFVYTDSTFFKLFSFPLLQGDLATALAGPNKVVVTETTARKYFNHENPIGKTLKISSGGMEYQISGIVKDSPNNSHIKFDFLASFSSLGISEEKTYWNANYTTYLLLKNQGSLVSLQKKIPGFMKKEMSHVFSGSDYLSYKLEPFTKIHLYSDYAGFEPNGSVLYVYIVSAVSLLILVIACFTFINLSTAKSVERAKEIGIRKVTGAAKSQIFWQFINESALIVFLASLLSLFLSVLFLPSFSELMARQLNVSEVLSTPIFIYCLIVVVVVSFLAGSYPALVLSSFQPVRVLKGAFKNTGSGVITRKSLFVFQFVVSIFLIICTVVIQKQLHFIQNTKLGFDREHVLVLPYDGKIHQSYVALKTQLLQNTEIVSVAKGDFEPCKILGGYSMQTPESQQKSYGVFAGSIDEDYLKTCGIKLLAGKELNERDVQDASHENYKQNYFHFLLNEAAVKQMGWTVEEAIGKKMFLDEARPGEVTGVLADFHFASLHESIKPLVLFPGNYANKIFIKVGGTNLDQTLAYSETVWKNVMTHRPFEFKFLDENYKSMYESELQLGKAMNVFTGIAVLLACLGLFGLSSYNIQQRTKEIGILKVLGAPLTNIVLRLTKNFISLVGMAILISVPLAWLTMSSWLQNYVYRVELTFSLFLISSLAALIIAFLTISFKAIKAANTNPVKSLRTE